MELANEVETQIIAKIPNPNKAVEISNAFKKVYNIQELKVILNSFINGNSNAEHATNSLKQIFKIFEDKNKT